jgi:low temperature requirement protein LtrA
VTFTTVLTNCKSGRQSVRFASTFDDHHRPSRRRDNIAVQIHRPQARQGTQEAAVTPLELFFDLVFVFALTQVTAYMAHELSWHGLIRGVLIVVLLWWAWTGYAWLANVVSAEQAQVKVAMLVSMVAMFVMALCIPEAFHDGPGGLFGPIVLAFCYLVFRLMHLILFWLVSEGDPGLRRQVLRFAPAVIGGTGMLLIAAQFHGWVQTALWAGALVVDYVGTALGGASGWRLPAPRHFAERHGLIVIVALGESIVAIGVGVAERPISTAIIVASVLGLALASAMWWGYFDVSALQGEHALSSEPIETRPRLARNAFSYAHLPLVISIVLIALGLKKVLEFVADTEHHTLTDPLPGPGLAALLGGVVLYLLAHVLFKWLTVHALSVIRLGGAAVLLAALPLTPSLPALGQLAVAAGVLIVALVIESIIWSESRQRIRSELSPHIEA